MEIDGVRSRLSAGQTVHIPAGVIHSGANLGEQVGRRLLLFSPAGMERFFLEAGAATSDGRVDPATVLACASRHGWEFT
jgi:quercetin dioxygenase-like cupin family protein